MREGERQEVSAPYTYIKRKTEDAVASLITRLAETQLTGMTIAKGLSCDSLTGDRIEVVCAEAEPEIIGATVTGNWTVQLRLAVVSNGHDTTRATHMARSGELEDIVMRDDVAEQVNNLQDISDYRMFDGTAGWLPGSGEDRVDGDEMRTEINVTVYCCPWTEEE